MKKLISFMMSLILFTTTLLTFNLSAMANELSIGSICTFEIDCTDSVTLQYTPEDSGVYGFYSIGDVDTIGEVFDSSGISISKNDDYIDSNFCTWVYLEKDNLYTLEVSIFDVSKTETVSVGIKKSNIDSIEFLPLNEIEVVENVNGIFDGYFIYNEPTVQIGDLLTINYIDGSVLTYSYDGENFVNGEDIAYGDFSFATNQSYDNQYSIGENFATFSFNGFSCEVPYYIVENTVESIEFKPKSTKSFLENFNGFWEYDEEYDDENDIYYQTNDRFIYFIPTLADGDKLVVNYIDGTTKEFETTLDKKTNEYVFKDGENTLDVEIKSNQYDNQWSTENTNSYYIEYCGRQSSVNVSINKLPYNDLGDYTNYYYTPVAFMYYNNIITGTSSTTFSPSNSLTRAMLITILYRLSGSPSITKEYNFTDIDSETYYKDAANWAYDNGITNQLTFRPNDKVSREEVASFLYRYTLKFYDSDLVLKDISSFPDASSVSDWAKDAMAWAVENEIITGTAKGLLNPKGSATRIHSAKMLYHFAIAYNIGDGNPYDGGIY